MWHYFDDEESWKAFRFSGIGGSEAPTIMGASPWTSLYSLAMHKRGLAPDKEERPAMTWGKRLEPIIVQAWVDEVGAITDYNEWRKQVPGKTHRIYQSDRQAWRLATPDAIILSGEKLGMVGPGVLEVKTTGKSIDNLDDPDDELRREYDAQLLHNIDTMDMSWGVLCALSRGSRMGWYILERDAHQAMVLRESEQVFWQMISAGAMPQPDGSTSTSETLKRAFPHDDGSTIKLDDGYITVVDEWLRYREEASALFKKADEAINNLKAAMGAASYATLSDGRRLKCVEQKRKGYTVAPTSYRYLALDDEDKPTKRSKR